MTRPPTPKSHLYLILGLSALLYLPSLFGDFVYDDHYLIQENSTLQSRDGIRAAFTDDYYGQANPQYALGYYRPLSLLTHWLDWQIWGNRPWGHHLTNLLLHLCCTAVFYLLLIALFEDSHLALLATTIFAAHPAHVATVSFISGRVDALAALFALLSLLFFCTRRLLAGPAYLAALLSKEISATIPALAFWKEKEKGWGAALRCMIPFVIALAAALALRFTILQFPRAPLFSFSFQSLTQAVRAIPAYLRLLVLPPLQLYLEPSPFQMPLLPDLAAALFFGLGVWFLKDRKIASWSLVWLVTLLPVLGFIRLETSLDERFLYLPSISFCLLAGAWVLQYLRDRSGESPLQERHVIVACALIFALMAPLLIVRQFYWHNDLSLFKSAVTTDPSSSKIRLRLGVALLEAGDAGEAEQQFREGLKLTPESAQFTAALTTHLATALQMQGRQTGVEDLYRKALELAPDYFTAHFDLGLYYKKSGRIAEAVTQFQEAVRANPRSETARRMLLETQKEH